MARVMVGRDVLRDAHDGVLSGEWVYFHDKDSLGLDTQCLVLDSDDDAGLSERGTHLEAVRMGFPRQGLDVASIAGTAEWVRRFAEHPSDELLLESFVYYLTWDAFLSAPGAPDPPPVEDIQRRMDREFIDGLGEERTGARCRQRDCARGTVAFSALCRRHHFETVMKREYPFPEERA